MPSAGARPRALAAGRVRRPLCPLPKPVLQWRPPGGLRELSRLPQSPFPPCMTIPKRPVAKAGARQELREKLCARGARGGRLAPAGLPCHGVRRGLPLAAQPGPQHGPGLSGTCSWRGGHVTFTQFSHSKRLPLSWDIWWRMRLDFQLKALGHWSHLYSLSSVWTTMCCSRLRREHRGHGRARLPPLPGGEGPSVPRGPFSAVVTAASTPCSEVRARPGTRPSTAPLDRPVGWRRRGGLPKRARALSETTQGPGPHVLAALRDDLNLEADLVPESKGAHRRHEPEGGSGPGSPRRPLRGLGVRAGHARLGRGVGWDVGVG